MGSNAPCQGTRTPKNQNQRKKEARDKLKDAREQGDKNRFLAAARNTGNLKKRELAAQAGVDVDGLAVICMHPIIVAGATTDLTKRLTENYMSFGVTCSSSRSLTNDMDTLHEMQNIVHRSSHKLGEEVETKPNASSSIRFSSRDFKTHSSRPLFPSHPITDVK